MRKSIGRNATLWTITFALMALLMYAGNTLLRIAPIGTGYAAKILCTGVFVSGRPASQVTDEDIQERVHPLLHLVHATIDAPTRSTRATFLGMAAREAWFRPGLGCTLKFGDQLAGPASMPKTARPDASNRAVQDPEPSPNGNYDALRRIVDSAFEEADPLRLKRTRALVVMVEGRVVAQRFAPGYSADTPLIGWARASLPR